MLRVISIALIIIAPVVTVGQVTLIREGVSINNTTTGSWAGDNISRSTPTNLTYQNNSITSVNTSGYMLQAGDEVPGSTNNNLDGAKFLGNKFTWNGVNSQSVITHGIFTGYNKNLVTKYNYLENVPFGIIFKSGTDAGTNMTFTAGGCAYNICKNGKFAVRLKGMNGVKIYNNTFYNGDNSGSYLVLITSNTDRTNPVPSTGVEIHNNIFYTTSKIPMITIEQGSLGTLQCDYNIYWSTAGAPTFMIDGVTFSWAQWQAKGFDLHSEIVDPNFINTTDFVPLARLNYGKNLGAEWQTGLATSAKWIVGTPPATTNQNGTWQVGARIYQAIQVSKITLTGANGATSISTYKGSLQLAAQVFPENAADKTVSWTIVSGTSLASVNSSGLVTATGNGMVTARATANDGSGVYDDMDIAITNQNILVQSIAIIDNLTSDTIKGIGTKLALTAAITPANATNKTVLWSVENLTGQATIDIGGELTTKAAGAINVVARATDGSQVSFQKKYIIALPTSVQNQPELSDFTIFPNPASEKIQIRFNKLPIKGVLIEIINLAGQLLASKRVFENLSEWSVAQLSGNVFLVKVTNETGTMTKKIIVN